MIYINFIYKNTCVHQASVEMDFTEENKSLVYDDIIHGSIPRPENYDKVLLTKEKLKNALWVSEKL